MLVLCMAMTYISLLGINTPLLVMIITSLRLHVLSRDRLVQVLTWETLTALPHLELHVVELELELQPEILVPGHYNHHQHHKADHVPPAAKGYITAAVLTGANKRQEQDAVLF